MTPALKTALGAIATSVALLPAAPAWAASPGGASASAPAVSAVHCVSTTRVQCASEQSLSPGSKLVVDGSDLGTVTSVSFLGKAGKADDVTIKPGHVADLQLDAVVPAKARSGRVQLKTAAKQTVRTRSVEVVPPAATAVSSTATPGAGPIFPIRGPHNLGETSTNDFGGPRGHQGQDMFAACGTPLVVVKTGTVRQVGYDDRGGNFAVITSADDGRDFVFMHMAAAPDVATGQAVTAGQPLGEVGETGDAQGCHLHFEIWTAPGWYVGGAPIDPKPELTAWDELDPPHKHPHSF